jgi:hypothetical protein
MKLIQFLLTIVENKLSPKNLPFHPLFDAYSYLKVLFYSFTKKFIGNLKLYDLSYYSRVYFTI